VTTKSLEDLLLETHRAIDLIDNGCLLAEFAGRVSYCHSLLDDAMAEVIELKKALWNKVQIIAAAQIELRGEQCSVDRGSHPLIDEIRQHRALLEVSAGEALKEAHLAVKRLMLYEPEDTDESAAHAALDAAVAAAVREEREKSGHVKACYCHHVCGGGYFYGCDGTKHPYTDPRCEVKE